jgi:hypothetical protein
MCELLVSAWVAVCPRRLQSPGLRVPCDLDSLSAQTLDISSSVALPSLVSGASGAAAGRDADAVSREVREPHSPSLAPRCAPRRRLLRVRCGVRAPPPLSESRVALRRQEDALLQLLRMDPAESGLPAGLEEAPMSFGPTFPFDPTTHDFVQPPAPARPLSHPAPRTLLPPPPLPVVKRGWPGRVLYGGPGLAVRCERTQLLQRRRQSSIKQRQPLTHGTGTNSDELCTRQMGMYGQELGGAGGLVERPVSQAQAHAGP